MERLTIFGSDSVYDSVLCMFPHDGSGLKIEIEGVCNSAAIRCQINGSQERVLLDAKELDRSILRQNEGISGELETDIFTGEILTEYENEIRREQISVNRFSRVSGTSSSAKDKFNIVYAAPFEHLRGSILSRIVGNQAYKSVCLKALQLFDPNIEDMLILK